MNHPQLRTCTTAPHSQDALIKPAPHPRSGRLTQLCMSRSRAAPCSPSEPNGRTLLQQPQSWRAVRVRLRPYECSSLQSPICNPQSAIDPGTPPRRRLFARQQPPAYAVYVQQRRWTQHQRSLPSTMTPLSPHWLNYGGAGEGKH